MSAASIQGLPRTTQPTNQQTGDNQSGADIPPYRIVKRVLAGTPGGIALATTNADFYCGTTTETIYNTRGASYQDAGLAVVETGGVFAVGDRLTSDASGRAIKSTALTQSLLGRAYTASSGAGDFASYESRRDGNIA
jgi:hypothetical protein